MRYPYALYIERYVKIKANVLKDGANSAIMTKLKNLFSLNFISFHHYSPLLMRMKIFLMLISSEKHFLWKLTSIHLHLLDLHISHATRPKRGIGDLIFFSYVISYHHFSISWCDSIIEDNFFYKWNLFSSFKFHLVRIFESL